MREYKRKASRAKYKVAPLEIGDKVRYLLDKERGKYRAELQYKSYRGKHWSAAVHSVVKYNKFKDAYYVASKYRTRDKLLKVSGVDDKTDKVVSARHRSGKKKFAEIGFEW